jgi:hypothetical protein
MTTTENNKLIAEFMGILNIDDTKYIETLKEMKSNGLYFEQGYMTSELKYDTDWNWLMPVVEKIEELGYDFDINKRENDNNVFIRGSQYSKTTSNKTKIEAVYNACVEFIKWYNNQNKKI